jgi:hypothetical protein
LILQSGKYGRAGVPPVQERGMAALHI